MNSNAFIAVLGIGNPWGSDDAVGPRVIEILQQDPPHGVRLIQQSGQAMELMNQWDGAVAAILVDAVSSGRPIGSIVRFDIGRGEWPESLESLFGGSTHSFGLAEAIELSRTLGTLPRHVIFYGVEGACFLPGQELSAEVEQALPEVAEQVRLEIRALPCCADATGECHE